MKQLSLPDDAKDDPDALEMARIRVTGSDLPVSLNIGSCAAADGPGESTGWCDILADIIKHLANAISQHSDTPAFRAQHEILARCTEAPASCEKHFTGQFKP